MTVPTGLSATPISASQVNLSWDTVVGATGYDIERNGQIIIFNHADRTYSDTGLDADTQYTYRVRSVGVAPLPGEPQTVSTGIGLEQAITLPVTVRTTSPQVLLLVDDPEDVNIGDSSLAAILNLHGYQVTYAGKEQEEDLTGIDVLVVGGSQASQDTGLYVDPVVPVVCFDSWRMVGMGSEVFATNADSEIEIVDEGHALADGITGVYDAYVSSAWLTWEEDLVANPHVIATRPAAPDQAVIFYFEAGEHMFSRFATTRHVAFGITLDGFAAGVTPDIEAQIAAALAWARDTTHVPNPGVWTAGSNLATGVGPGVGPDPLRWTSGSGLATGTDAYSPDPAEWTSGSGLATGP